VQFVCTRRFRRRGFQSRAHDSTLRRAPIWVFFGVRRRSHAHSALEVAIPTLVSLSGPEGRTPRSGLVLELEKGKDTASSPTPLVEVCPSCFYRHIWASPTQQHAPTTHHQHPTQLMVMDAIGTRSSHAGTRPLGRCTCSKIILLTTLKQDKAKELALLCSSLTDCPDCLPFVPDIPTGTDSAAMPDREKNGSQREKYGGEIRWGGGATSSHGFG